MTEDNRKIIFPLLFDMVYLPNNHTRSNFIFADSLSEADVAIFPVDIVSFLRKDKTNFFHNWIEKVSQNKMPIWIYAGGDFGFALKNENVLTFRLGGFNSKLAANTCILPCFINDPYDKILKNDFFVLPKKEKPNIGFVGNANGSYFKFIKELLLYIQKNVSNLGLKYPEDYHSFYPVGKKRHQLLYKIQKEKKIQSNFIFRDRYRARNENKEKTTIEFFKNIQDNLYTFCLRGNGNFSVRFYEALIMGRIPVLIDTDVRLPLSDKINWTKHCLIVSEDSIIQDLILFHTTKTEMELKQIQENNRKLVLEKLNRIDYFIQIANEKFKNK
ncbi:exostosin domain-containing protein [Flavobacterium ginsenosidimutans]|uniref:Exostosin family protein n=1 Tax=Flavobacterium ginsenosidimutans TaxID=687844 RepID=A0ABZ2Q852_9FLAO|nr:exostosin family protein [Flavobacterium ginsenosidimutans]KAF2334193.1 exostosin family protein [Flavobacterium ginsenosidimutans]